MGKFSFSPRTTRSFIYGVFLGILASGVHRTFISLRNEVECVSPYVENVIADPTKKPLEIYYNGTKYNLSILCIVNTMRSNYERRAMHSQNTWTRRCKSFWFLGQKSHAALHILPMEHPVEEGRQHLWLKIRETLRQLHRTANHYDYIYKADDDTYAVMENLLHVLHTKDPNQPFMLGHRNKGEVNEGFLSGGSGYIISRAALKLLVEKSLDIHPDCPRQDGAKEDVKLTLCARLVNISIMDVLDEQKVSLFRIYSLHEAFKSVKRITDQRNMPDPNTYIRQDRMRFSSKHISFHYVTPPMMYIMEFIVYFLRPIGVQ